MLLENAAVVLAIAYVFLAARSNIWCWPCALVSTGIYTGLFWQVTLPFQSFLNGYYALMAIYGWLQWRKIQGEQEVSIRTWSWSKHSSAIVGLSLTAWAMAALAEHWFDSDYLYQDVFITIFSLFVTYMVTQRVIENWLYWIVINAVAVHLYWVKAMHPTAILFACYLGFAVYGYFSWQKQARQQQQLVTL